MTDSFHPERMRGLLVIITRMCNMSCRHCAIAPTPDGPHMGMETFKALCEKLRELPPKIETKVCLSGGEPTMHPHFWDFLDMTLDALRGKNIRLQISTNGSQTADALRLAEMAGKGIIEARLSYTEWHDRSMVSPGVVRAFDMNTRHIQTRSGGTDRIKPSPTGRAARWTAGTMAYCYWSDWFVDVTGEIYFCGCMKERAGSVFDADNILARESRPCLHFPDIDHTLNMEAEKIKNELGLDNLSPLEKLAKVKELLKKLENQKSKV